MILRKSHRSPQAAARKVTEFRKLPRGISQKTYTANLRNFVTNLWHVPYVHISQAVCITGECSVAQAHWSDYIKQLGVATVWVGDTSNCTLRPKYEWLRKDWSVDRWLKCVNDECSCSVGAGLHILFCHYIKRPPQWITGLWLRTSESWL